ncbi:MAG: tetratricopeptide repeat protein [Phycisphaerae bacterium]|nr:tetratricopeptide repeat protein [Phycisphaerae bacterium]
MADTVPPSRLARTAACVRHGVSALCLIALTFLLYLPLLHAAFAYDDTTTIVANRLIDSFSFQTVARLFGGFHLNDYYPVFYLSLMLDRRLWNMNPSGFHLTNLFLHAVNVLLVYALAIRLAARTTAPSDNARPALSSWLLAMIAALLFAIHPNHVEPVAWLTGRKVLLAGMWGLLAVHAYLTGLTDDRRRWPAVAAAILCAALACMSNVYAMVVPVLIVVVDRNVTKRTWLRASWINWPLALVSAGAVVMKLLSRIGGVARPSQFDSKTEWLCTTVALYWTNLRSLFAPYGRNVLYPSEVVHAPAELAFQLGAGAILATLVLLWIVRKRGLWNIGLMWFLLALLPTSQLARHHIFRADRYLYFPGIGACLLAGLIVATLWAWSRRWPWRLLLIALCLVVLTTLARASRARTHDWTDDETLWTASLAQNEQNADAHQSLGCMLMRRGKPQDALDHLRRAVDLRPGHVDAHNTLCSLLLQMNRPEEAVNEGKLAVEIRPDLPEAKFNLARALMATGDYALALQQFRRGLEQKPTDIGARYYLARTLSAMGRTQDAVDAYQHALALNDGYVEARYALALALIQLDRNDQAQRELTRLVTDHPDFGQAYCRLAELAVKRRDDRAAVEWCRKGIQAQPALAEPRNNLAWLLATSPDPDCRNGAEALALAKPLTEGPGQTDPAAWDTLAAAYAELGEFNQAVHAAQRAIELAENQNNPALTNRIRPRLDLYRASRPYRQPPTTTPSIPPPTSSF